jgi:hypothetical protein
MNEISEKDKRQIERLQYVTNIINRTWIPLYEWQIKFRKENNLSIKEFIMNGSPDQINRSYFHECLGIYGLQMTPSNNERSPGFAVRKLIENVKMKSEDPNYVLLIFNKMDKDKEFIEESCSILKALHINIDKNIHDSIVINVNVNLSIFNTKKYKYGETENEELLEINRNTLTEIISEHLNKVGKSNIEFKIGRITNSRYS